MPHSNAFKYLPLLAALLVAIAFFPMVAVADQQIPKSVALSGSDGPPGTTDAALEFAVPTPMDADVDGDGVNQATETRLGTDSTASDTDGDGLEDGAERRHGTDPTQADTDGDGVDDGTEIHQSLDALAADTDGDGLTDREELDGPTDPTAVDTDGDGLSDGEERKQGTVATQPDTDGDGLTDSAEVKRTGSNPLVTDSDGDFLSDQSELSLGGDPTNWLSPITVPGTFAGFLFGVVLSVGISNRRLRPGRLLDGAVALRSRIERGDDAAQATTHSAEPVTEPSADEPSTDKPADTIYSDEAFIEHLLSASDGRLNQAAIVSQTDWSKSKVSRLLSAMADDGDVVKIQLGRENLICLPGAEPAIVRSTGRDDRRDSAPPTSFGNAANSE
ncbi:MarR family transcriptional regulator [Haladaptatus sp. DYSN1]|uniref:helix-turn-helix transcriptional regulator n=1 Tax=unclassified Haladaptatus TaxID=2622732 RepID=UPI00240669C7|nr:MarR family transcriptional regulator [Haladaptatus sp. DYSN1]